MTAWLPALKAILPYVSQVVSLALPVFTKMVDKSKAADVIPNQIQELQAAVTSNTESLKILADQVQKTISGIDSGASSIENEVRAIRRLCVAAIFVSVMAIVVGIASWLH